MFVHIQKLNRLGGIYMCHGRNRSIQSLLAVFLILFGWMAAPTTAVAKDPVKGAGFGEEIVSPMTGDSLLDQAFRIDIQTIDVIFNYHPDQYYADVSATLNFKMRPGQTYPVFHLDPAFRDTSIVTNLLLNGESLQMGNTNHVRLVTPTDSTQGGIELRRALAAGGDHSLRISYRLNLPNGYPRFSTECHDIYGHGNEEIFPTLNTPHELARHTLVFRVHGNVPFRCIGSGLVTDESTADIQQWRLDTEREIASYTVFFALMPKNDTNYDETTIDGVAVRVMSYRNGASIAEAFHQLRWWIPELVRNLGPFPIPRGISIFLTSTGGGMEYYGGTISSLWALNHEVFHMYFACSAVMKTYRDTWIDEALCKWFELNYYDPYTPIYDGYTSNMVSGRSPVAVGFDSRAYTEGARIMASVAQRLGGRSRMVAFLKYVHDHYMFSPFTTRDFIGFIKDFSGVDLTADFENWVFADESAVFSNQHQPLQKSSPVDLTPPDSILQQYRNEPGRK